MKKFITYAFSFLFSVIALAQETGYEPAEEGSSFSGETKFYFLLAVAVISIVLAARTFRNKPEI